MAATRIRLKDLASELGLELEGDPDLQLAGVAPLETAGPDQLSFARSTAMAPQLAATRAGAVIAPAGLDVGGRAALRSGDPGADFNRAVELLVPTEPLEPGVHPSAVIAEDATIDPSASVGPRCVVGRGTSIGARTRLDPGVVVDDQVTIGADCRFHAGCVIGARTVLGDRVLLEPGVVIGGQGFGYVGDDQGGLRRVRHIGRVVIEDDVEIGANSTVDRATLGETRIGRGTKIDNLVQIAHNCQIGERVLIAAQSALSGSVRVEKGAVLLGQSGIVGHLTIGEGALVGAKTGVHKDVAPRSRVFGLPQREERGWHRVNAALTRLPELFKRVRVIEKLLGVRDDGKGES